jgi:hypothetical protein
MLRKSVICCAVLAFFLAGCDKPASDDNEIHMNMPQPMNTLQAPPPPFVPPPDIMIPGLRANTFFSVQHNLTLTMPHDSVAARFAAARDACLKDETLHCVLTSASLSVDQTISARLQVALPHDKVALFETRLLNRLPQDGNGRVEATSRSTSTENETQSAVDIDRQLTQAKAYRDKLEDLSKRPNLSVEEVIKIHSELTEAQTAVENAAAAKRASDSDIVLERMNVAFEEAIVPVERFAFDGFWKNARNVIMASTADMLLRLVNALPWLPLAFVLAWLLARFMRRLQRRRTVVSA